MFQSRGGALAFAGITLMGVAGLVGTEDDDGALADSIAQIEQQGAEFREQTAQLQETAPPQQAPSPAPPAEAEVVTKFASDEDLIVDPTGFDPTPDLEGLPGTAIVALDPSAEAEPEE